MAAVQGSTESLPSDIVVDIVSRVPAESVLECKLVCKKWVTLIRQSNFTNMHLSRQINHLHGGDDYDGDDSLAAKAESCLFFACRVDDPDVRRTLLFHGRQLSDEKYDYAENLTRVYHAPMHHKPLSNHLVGSCNGLVCTFQNHNLVIDPIYICNPLTREYVYLPELAVKKEDIDPELLRVVGGDVCMYGSTACGFGYVRSTNEYKVVRIHYLKYGEGNVQVYTLGSGCGWREVDRVSYRVETMFGGAGTYANDAIYWISSRNVVAFDLADEKFRLVTAPPCIPRGDKYGLVALGTRLCLYMDRSHLEIWSLIKNGYPKETWCKQLDIDYEAVVGSRKWMFQPILLTKGGEIIFLYKKSALYCYDTKSALLRMISDESSKDYCKDVEVIPHINTFASLEAMGENSKRYTVRKRPRDDVLDELDRVALGEEIDTTRFRLG